ncbi:hypothetical protein CAP39_14350 [Sphingomonas sp. IBVSS1]|uniref:Lipoprotein n=1 Tax=Sandarakinorhabdus cyanobacteriorum TaxID=1981098 RepID=A0A255Y494_9SPHN|nr:hypothetical protein [Sandarakinorhabdus cyanobacteriorum]OSZ63240.1 hypothetical protein CAP39_14350 [Sphingomonas sp. IBVSS1]OYQ24036.1 hypothetical protein CHU93_16560 [Sandarakinorhabdus cyanobacteriorum]
MNTRLRALLLITSAVALAACDGASNIASPGEGTLVTPPPAPAPAPTPTPTPTPTGPADSCPTGTTNVGVINNLRNCQISGTITGGLTLANLRGVVYSLSGRVNVGIDLGADPAAPAAGGQQGILTIEPGVVIFGSSGADALVVNRGSQIFAEGTATRPIVFTSRSNMEGNVNASSIGQWGGIVILGRAPIHTCVGAGATPGTVSCQSAVEGLTGAFYGGGSPTDNSGRLAYIQVRYPGFEVSSGNELNGITFGGVGSGTFASFIQVHNSSDDGIEWFGGRVNHKNIVITGADDDSIDTDLGYKGLIQYALVVQRTDGGDRVIEADTAGGEARTPRSNPRIANFTFIGRRTPDTVLLRGGTDYGLVNGIIQNSTATGLCLDIDGAQTAAAADAAADEAGAPVIRSVIFGCSGAARDESDVPLATITPIITGNNNLLPPVTLTLTSLFLPGTFETGATATNPRTALTGTGTFFDETTFVGAFRNATDTWYTGWTCGVGAGATACEAAPSPIR